MRISLGQPIIIENVSGAEGTIGTGRAARARPDGYTIILGFSGAMTLNAAWYSLPYDVLNDFAPILPLTTNSPVLFAKKTMPANDLRELIAWLKANPNRASAGISSSAFRLLNHALSEGNWDAIHPRALSWRPSLHAGPVDRSDRCLFRLTR
jgi:tripartite-type tricarboxylate transporter receptor subunit TctC